MESRRYLRTTVEFIFRVPLSIHPFVRPSVHPSVHPSVKHLLCANFVLGSVQTLGIQQEENQTEVSAPVLLAVRAGIPPVHTVNEGSCVTSAREKGESGEGASAVLGGLEGSEEGSGKASVSGCLFSRALKMVRGGPGRASRRPQQ